MPQFSTTRRVRHAAADMFHLVADVERYPEFVPLCKSLRIRKRIDEPEDVQIIVADMVVSFKLIEERFTSRVTLDHANLLIVVEYLEGPFSRMENRWEFHPVEEQICDVKFFISYEFKSRTLSFLMGTMFETAFRRFSDAFERRADVIYGKRYV